MSFIVDASLLGQGVGVSRVADPVAPAAIISPAFRAHTNNSSWSINIITIYLEFLFIIPLTIIVEYNRTDMATWN